jgi:hypothetical protein
MSEQVTYLHKERLMSDIEDTMATLELDHPVGQIRTRGEGAWRVLDEMLADIKSGEWDVEVAS